MRPGSHSVMSPTTVATEAGLLRRAEVAASAVSERSRRVRSLQPAVRSASARGLVPAPTSMMEIAAGSATEVMRVSEVLALGWNHESESWARVR